MPPAYIRTSDELAAAVQLTVTTESLFLDFKQTINDWNVSAGAERQRRLRDAQRESCRDIAQFANSDGGCLVIGIAEERNPAGVKVAQAIVPVQDPDSMRQWIEQAIRNYLVPATFTRDVVIVPDARGTVLVVNVPPSRHTVSLWDHEARTVEYLYRTSHGKEWMNPDEAERHMMNGSRAARLAVEAARARATSTQVEVTGGYRLRHPNTTAPDSRWRPPGPVNFGASGADWFELRVPTGSAIPLLTVPYGLVDEAWVDASGRVNLLLSVSLVVVNGEVVLERQK